MSLKVILLLINYHLLKRNWLGFHWNKLMDLINLKHKNNLRGKDKVIFHQMTSIEMWQA